MNDIVWALLEDIRDKAVTGRSARNKVGGCGAVSVRLPNDHTADGRLNGPVYVYQLGLPMTKKQFAAMPGDLQTLYVRLLRDKHGATAAEAEFLTGDLRGVRFTKEGNEKKWALFITGRWYQDAVSRQKRIMAGRAQ